MTRKMLMNQMNRGLDPQELQFEAYREGGDHVIAMWRPNKQVRVTLAYAKSWAAARTQAYQALAMVA